ncbi:hypothetical protein V1514DRAFT_345614 [Lipomyces japonicus]|uniref:uncharacterized protein n=1 Tax=Lipomyces japonicus TaxID=56871 RepID=UPI0034D012A8
MLLRSLLIAVSTALIIPAASAWNLVDGSLSIVDQRSGVLESGSFTQSRPLNTQLSLLLGTVARIKFSTRSEAVEAVNHKPHQAYVIVKDSSTGLETAFPAEVRDNGRGKLDIEYKTIPLALLGQNKTLDLQLVIASFGNEASIKISIGSILPQFNDVAVQSSIRYGPRPEIIHQFKPDPSFISKPIAIFFSALIIGAGFVVLGLWAYIGIKPSEIGNAVSNAPIGYIGFFGSIIAIEIAFFNYYLGSTIFKLIGQISIIAPIAFFTGSRALREVRERRLKGQW